MSMSGKSKRQIAGEDEAVSLAHLMEQDSSLEHDFEVVEAQKPKRKRKSKPQTTFQIPNSVVVGIAALLIGFVGATMITFIQPVDHSQSVAVPQPIEQAAPITINTNPQQSNAFVDRWMLLRQPIGEIQANSFVRVLSQDDSPEYFNVADMQGHLAIVLGSELSEAENAPADDVYPPLGPYNDALGKNQKLLVTIERNGDMPPGTLVYAMGWRAQDGTWVYEVSPDRVKIYYLPFIHLAWAKEPS
jgi:hypothetical protein